MKRHLAKYTVKNNETEEGLWSGVVCAGGPAIMPRVVGEASQGTGESGR